MILATAVHTIGINWESVGAIVGIILPIVTIVLGLLARWVTNRITDAINTFRIEVVDKMETRVSILEALQVNRRRLNDQTRYVRCDSLQYLYHPG